jgi:hypothetical protein
MPPKITPRLEIKGSDYKKTGFYAANSWKYELLVDYLKLSPSYRWACESSAEAERPKDWRLVDSVFADFGNVLKIKESDWWNKVGFALYGVKAAKTELIDLGFSTDSLLNSTKVDEGTAKWSEMASPECLLMAVPTNQTKATALRQIREIFKATKFHGKSESIKPKYSIQSSKLRQRTLVDGVDALKKYKAGMPLWLIGHRLLLSDASSKNIAAGHEVAEAKRYLQILASKLIHKAELIAENAARGRFPSDKAFPEAMLVSNQRKVGRPKKS